MPRFKDWTGSRFGKIVVVSRAENTKHGGTSWNCKCDCGTELVKSAVTLKQSESCGCARMEAHVRRRMPDGEAGLSKAFSSCKSQAKKRKLEFSLDLEGFRKVVVSSCFYCGDLPGHFTVASKDRDFHSLFRHWGVDRIDNERGYVSDNVVACCWWCNRAKGNDSIEKLFLQVFKIFQNHQTKMNHIHPDFPGLTFSGAS